MTILINDEDDEASSHHNEDDGDQKKKSPHMTSIDEEGGESSVPTSKQRKSLLQVSKLPKSRKPQFSYAASRVGRIRDSFASELSVLESDDDSFSDEAK